MTILTILSLTFVWLTIREVFGGRDLTGKFDLFNIGYTAVLALLAVLCAWMPVKYWKLESLLADKASELAGRPASFHCNSLFDSVFDNDLKRIGHANPKTGEIVFQFGWCKNIMKYLKHPESPTTDELVSLALFAHEAMHIRGELNEQKTECQAIQRMHVAAEMLGVSREIGRQNALTYYHEIYAQHPYFSPKCAVGKEYDEGIADFLGEE